MKREKDGKDILILGGGPAGMAAAMELHKHDTPVTIVEKEQAIGGLAKTLTFTESDGSVFRTDIGPHRFFSKNQYLYDFIEDLLEEQWIVVPRQTRQLIEGKFYEYPIKIGQALKNIGFVRGVGMMLSYTHAFIEYKIFRKKIVSFEDYIVANFGRKLGEFNMLNYTEKIWGIPCSEIHPDWAKQRIKGLNLFTAVLNAIIKTDGPKTLVDEFYYPQYGTGLIYETIAEKIKASGSSVRTNSYATKVEHDGKKITGVEVKEGDTSTSYAPEAVVSSVPITEFIKTLTPPPPQEVFEAAQNLKWRSQVYLFVTLDKEQVTKDNWIYTPNKELPFGRLSEMKNFSKDMAPSDKTSYMIEFFVTEGDDIWNMDKDTLFNHVIGDFEALGLFTKDEVRQVYHLKKSHVYPVYDLDHEKNLAVLKEYLDSFENLFYVGRPGRFRYNNQDHSLEMGIAAARGIKEGTHPDFDAIGSEDEYYEKGSVPVRQSKRIKQETILLFIGYVFVAGFATIVDIAVLYGLTERLGIHYFTSAFFGYGAGMVTNYTLNKVFNFKNKSKKVVQQFGIFASVALVGLVLNQIIIYGLVEFAGIGYLVAKIVSVGVVMFWSFWGHKKLTFKFYQ